MNTPDEHTRVVVVGTSCAGKSTFSQALSESLASARIELDALYWGPDWRPKPAKEFQGLVAEAASRARWIADGNYGVVRQLLWARATTIIWLNYSFSLVLWRALKRTITRCVTGELLWHGNRETVWRSFFTKDSILLWVATTHHRRQREFAALRDSGQFPHLVWLEFRHPAEAKHWLAQCQNDGRAPHR